VENQNESNQNESNQNEEPSAETHENKTIKQSNDFNK
jgi:hypothetical protein